MLHGLLVLCTLASVPSPLPSLPPLRTTCLNFPPTRSSGSILITDRPCPSPPPPRPPQPPPLPASLPQPSSSPLSTAAHQPSSPTSNPTGTDQPSLPSFATLRRLGPDAALLDALTEPKASRLAISSTATVEVKEQHALPPSSTGRRWPAVIAFVAQVSLKLILGMVVAFVGMVIAFWPRLAPHVLPPLCRCFTCLVRPCSRDEDEMGEIGMEIDEIDIVTEPLPNAYPARNQNASDDVGWPVGVSVGGSTAARATQPMNSKVASHAVHALKALEAVQSTDPNACCGEGWESGSCVDYCRDINDMVSAKLSKIRCEHQISRSNSGSASAGVLVLTRAALDAPKGARSANRTDSSSKTSRSECTANYSALPKLGLIETGLD